MTALVRCADCAHQRQHPDPIIRAKMSGATRCVKQPFSWFSPILARQWGLFEAVAQAKEGTCTD